MVANTLFMGLVALATIFLVQFTITLCAISWHHKNSSKLKLQPLPASPDPPPSAHKSDSSTISQTHLGSQPNIPGTFCEA